MIQDRLKFADRLYAILFTQPSLTTQIVLVKIAHTFITAGGLQYLK